LQARHGQPVSACARSISASPSATISSAIASRNAARAASGWVRYASNASRASSHARSTSAGDATPNAGVSICAPLVGSNAYKVPAEPATASAPISISPVSCMGVLRVRSGMVRSLYLNRYDVC
jgi:hypothetical protein